MQLLVFSDSHGRRRNMEEALALHPKAEYVLFLGDGVRDFYAVRELFPGPRFFCVRGNCDLAADERDCDCITVEGKKIFFTHGHLQGVKGGLAGLESAAGTYGADVALFGHTHVPYTAYRAGIHYMNPGSIGSGSYGVLDLAHNGILLNTALLP